MTTLAGGLSAGDYFEGAFGQRDLIFFPYFFDNFADPYAPFTLPSLPAAGGTVRLNGTSNFVSALDVVGTLELAKALSAGGAPLNFVPGNARLIAHGTILPANSLTGLTRTDRIDLPDLAVTPTVIGATAAGLQIPLAAGGAATLAAHPTDSPTIAAALSSSGAGSRIDFLPGLAANGQAAPFATTAYLDFGKSQLSAATTFINGPSLAGPAAGSALIVSGTQQAFALAARVLIGASETVVLEDPHYRGARQVFVAHGAHVRGCRVDAEGLVPSALPEMAGLITTSSAASVARASARLASSSAASSIVGTTATPFAPSSAR